MTDTIAPLNDVESQRLYQEGSVWMLTFVKVQPGMIETYWKEVGPARKRLMDDAIAADLVVSHKILNGFAFGKDDWDVLYLVEYSNFAAIDGLNERFEALNRSIMGSTVERQETVAARAPIREILGTKVMQEIHLA